MVSILDPRRLAALPAEVQRLSSAAIDLVDRFEQLSLLVARLIEETGALRVEAEGLRVDTRSAQLEVESLRRDLAEIREKIPGL